MDTSLDFVSKLKNEDGFSMFWQQLESLYEHVASTLLEIYGK